MTENSDSDSDIASHRATYGVVLGLLKYGAVACVLLALVIMMVIRR